MSYEIVAIRCGTLITNNPVVVNELILSGQRFQPLSRTHMKWMDAFDLGPRWRRLANGPTLFELDDETMSKVYEDEQP